MKNRIGKVVVAAGVLLLVASVAGFADELKGWERSIALGLTATSGNKDSIGFSGALTAQRAWEKDEWRLGLDGAYGRTEGETNAELLHGVAQYKHLFDARWYGYVLADALHDGVAALAYRLTLGPGAGYYFIKSDQTKLSAEAGPSYVYEKLDSADGRDFITLRLGERLDHKFNAAAKLWQTLEWLPDVGDFGDYLLIAEIGVETALTKALNLRVVAQDRYDSTPAAGLKNNDISLISGLSYKF